MSQFTYRTAHISSTLRHISLHHWDRWTVAWHNDNITATPAVNSAARACWIHSNIKMHVTHDATVLVLSSAFTHYRMDIHCHMNSVPAATVTALYETFNGNTVKNFYIHCSPTMTHILQRQQLWVQPLLLCNDNDDNDNNYSDGGSNNR